MTANSLFCELQNKKQQETQRRTSLCFFSISVAN
jgi:hypothetical protein